MTLVELILLAVGLSMDAFAVGITKGLALEHSGWREMSIVGGYFGVFQAVMPVIGYLLFSTLATAIMALDHWVAFILLCAIGGNMIFESFKHDTDGNASLGMKAMLPLAIATSIDALAIGITFGALQVNLLPAITLIGVTTFLISCVGVKIGHIFGSKYKSKAEFVGGIILICIGLKVLLEHMGVL